MSENPLKQLQKFGQSVWIDYIRRDMLAKGELKALIDQDGVRGVTSNPSIFEKAISSSPDYAAQLEELKGEKGLDAMGLYEQLAIKDIQAAADILAPVYRQTNRHDGYVSLEVSPHLAHDTKRTLSEARRLWSAVGKSNLMIKVPGAPEGMPAIETLISEGINVNVTLLFSREAYRAALEAYLKGLEMRAAKNQDVSGIASVASFFVSRIDTNLDAKLAKKGLSALQGKAAVANAKLAYEIYQKTISSDRWKALAKKGAQVQRLLWASTSTKNPAYSDVIYVDELIGPDTVNTIPPATIHAFRDHGKPAETLTAGVDEARRTMDLIKEAGISMDQATDELLVEGVKLFTDSFDKLLAAVEAHASRPALTAKSRF